MHTYDIIRPVWIRLVILLPLLTIGMHRVRQAHCQEATPVDATSFVLEKFNDFPIVALGERHGVRQLHDLYTEIATHPEFSKIGTVVLEYGNALHQDSLDRYLQGEDVPREQLQKVWRDMAVSLMLQYGSDQFVEFIDAVRAVNRERPASERIRILAGGPPVDWNKVQNEEDLMKFLRQRDAHYAGVVIQSVLNKGKKALIISGSQHFKRHNVPARIQQAHPNSVYVIQLLDGFGARDAELLAKTDSWKKPTIVAVKGTWLGKLDTGSIDSSGNIMLRSVSRDEKLVDGDLITSLVDGKRKKVERVINGKPVLIFDSTETDAKNAELKQNDIPSLLSGGPSGMFLRLPPGRWRRSSGKSGTLLEESTDGILFVGQRSQLTPLKNDQIWDDNSFWTELDRRHRVIYGKPLDPSIRTSRGANEHGH